MKTKAMSKKEYEAYWAPTWENQLREARLLPDEDLRRHAAVSRNNAHWCRECFCCAALTVLEDRRESR
jgi:hypothetical protein